MQLVDNDFLVSLRTWSATWGSIKIFIMCLSFILFTESFKIKSELLLSSALIGVTVQRVRSPFPVQSTEGISLSEPEQDGRVGT